MKTKDKVIDAVKNMIKKQDKGTYFFGTRDCKLCSIYRRKRIGHCKHCIQSLVKGAKGDFQCAYFKTYPAKKTIGESKIRAMFWKECLPILEEMRAKYFRRRANKSKHFAFMSDIDEKVYKEYLE